MALDVIRLHLALLPEPSDGTKQSRRRRDRRLLLDRVAALQASANPFDWNYLTHAAAFTLTSASAADAIASLMESDGFTRLRLVPGIISRPMARYRAARAYSGLAEF